MIQNKRAKRSGQNLYRQAKKWIPGGTQLLSKRPEMFLPDHWPAYYSKCQGVYVMDLTGRRYTDMSAHGIGACILGYADPDVNSAVVKAVRSGSMCTLNCPEEVELAELLCSLHPWAHQVRYARGGGEAMMIAVRIARAATGRDKVAFSGYHGWHDWYLSANLANDKNLDGQLLSGLEPRGVPRSLLGSTIPFHYQNRIELDRILAEQGTQLAAIVMEPARSTEPDPDFLSYVRAAASRIGAVLIFDEVTSGWRQTLGGIHLQTSIIPDMAVFAKGISNGYPMAAIIGVSEVMTAAQKTFISSTSWTEKIGPAAALATIHKMKKNHVQAHLVRMGKLIQKGWRDCAARYGLNIHVSGIYPLSHLDFQGDNALALRTLFTQLLLDDGFLASSAFYASYAHTEKHVESYLKAVDKAFRVISGISSREDIEHLLRGPVAHAGFQRLT